MLVEEELMDMGIIPQNKIVTLDQDGSRMMEYLLASTNNGDQMLIDLDDEGEVHSSGSTVFVETERVLDIPYSVKTASVECTGKKACGAAFVCDGGVCVLSRSFQDDVQKERTLIMASDQSRTATISGNPVPMPVVRLSSIRANPSAVVENVNELTKQFFNLTMNTCIQTTDRVREKLGEIGNRLDDFEEASRKAYETLGEDNYFIQQQRKESGMPRTPEQRKKYLAMTNNLSIRHAMGRDLLTNCQRIHDLLPALSKIVERLYELEQISDSYAETSGVVFTGEEIKLANTPLARSTLAVSKSSVNASGSGQEGEEGEEENNVGISSYDSTNIF